MSHPSGGSNFDNLSGVPQEQFVDDALPLTDDGTSKESLTQNDKSSKSNQQDSNEQVSVFDQVLAALDGNSGASKTHSLSRFLTEPSAATAIEMWLGRPIDPTRDTLDELATQLNQDVARIDQMLNRQVNTIIHHPKFQKLESSWRGLKYLHNVLVREHDPSGPEVKIKILDVSWKELEKDFESSFDVEQSAIFHKVYEQEFGIAGGEPFGLLVGDYEIKPSSVKDHPHDDFDILGSLGAVAASAFSPFLTNASPQLFEVEEFGELEEVSDLQSVFEGPSAVRWNSLCEREDSRFLGLAMPRMLMRLPYSDRPDLPMTREYQRIHSETDAPNEFMFVEDVRGPDSSKYLWGGAAFAMAAVVLRSFCRTGWLTDIRGVQRNYDGGGLIDDLPVEYLNTDSVGVAPRISTDVVITDNLERELSDLGFIPLCSCYDTGYSAFYSAKSIQTPKNYENELANVNAHISSMMYTMLCVSRFAHYLKKIGRDMVGRFTEAKDIERELHNWIIGFVTESTEATDKSEFPLADAKVSVRPIPGKSGHFQSVFHLQPHYEIEGLSAGVRLVTII